MKRDYPNLCKPLKVGNLTFRNRMVSAPMGATDITAEGTPGLRTQSFYEARAKGGAAAVTVSELVVHPETDGSQMLHLSLATPGQLGAFAYAADAIKRHGAIASIELSHSGQYAGTYMVDKKKKADLCQWGPSDGVRPDGLPVRALSVEQIEDIAAAYANAAVLARRAGFQMCMVHAGHGWLINQFLSPYFNKRTDEYGGSLENRLRFARQILTAIREATGPGFPIELRMSGSELFDGGYDIEEGCRIAQGLEDLVDLIHVSAGSYQFGFSITHPSMFREHGCNVPLAAQIKQHVSVPVIAIGGLSDPAQMEQIVASGQADAVAMARALLADPELPNKVMANQGNEVVKCLRCFVCMAERPVTQTRRCAVNPLIGREFEGLTVTPTARPKRVLVAGGGIAGMKAAHTAALRGHDVTLFEKTTTLGGQLNIACVPPRKEEMRRAAQDLIHAVCNAGVHLCMGQTRTAEQLKDAGFEAVINAVGAHSAAPRIPGIDSVNVADAWKVLAGEQQVYGTVAVIGGGMVGCETAEYLAARGCKVSVIEMMDKIAAGESTTILPTLLENYKTYGVEQYPSHKVKEFRMDAVVCENKDGAEVTIPCDYIVLAMGARSNEFDAAALEAASIPVYSIGDAAGKAADISNAIRTGYDTACQL